MWGPATITSTRAAIAAAAAALLACLALGPLAAGALGAAKPADRVERKLLKTQAYERVKAQCKGARKKADCSFRGTRRASGGLNSCKGRASVSRRGVDIRKQSCDPAEEPVPPTPPPPSGTWPRLGFNGYYPTAMKFGQQAGATTSRIFARWATVEASQGTYDWTVPDRQYNALVAAGMPPVIVLMAAPTWAREPGSTCPNGTLTGCWFAPAPSFDDEWAAFAAAAAQRYPDAIGFEVWNEQNSQNNWAPRTDPARFVEVARAARTGVKAVDPATPVVLGGLGQFQTNAVNTSAPDFLLRTYEAGGRGVFDAIGVHTYPGKYNATSYLASARAQIDPMLKVATAYGDTAPLWLTEVGISTTGTTLLAATPQEQADELAKVYQYARDVGMGVVIVHKLLDGADVPTAGNWGYGFGLVNADLTPKPALCVFAQLRGEPCVAP